MARLKDKEKVEASVEEAEAVTLNMTMLPNGQPLFIGDVEDVVDQAVKQGYTLFYVLGTHRNKQEVPTYQGSTTMRTEYGPFQPKLFKVVSNLVTQAVMMVDDTAFINTLKLEQLSEIAYFRLPKIPYQLIDKLDAFFRRIAEKLGTESVVILTYDVRLLNTENPNAGWGVVVPKQTNTGGYCKYEPASVTDQIPDEDAEFIRLVGTAHSHPGMSAFASHTDHGDQLNNDGVHITFGWPKNGPTAFHIEMQCAGSTYSMSEALTFTERPFSVPDDEAAEIEQWSKNVTKKEEPPKAIAQPGRTGRTTPPSSFSGNYANEWDELNRNWPYKIRNMQFPKEIPHPMDNVLITNLLDESEKKCPICGAHLTSDDLSKRKCFDCHAFLLINPDEKIEEALAKRKEKVKMIVRGLEDPGNYPIRMVKRTLVDQQVRVEVITLHEGDPTKIKKN